MKTTLFILICAITMALSSCSSSSKSDDGSTYEFLTLHYNNDNQLNEGAYLSILKVKDGEVSYEKLAEIYPHNSLRDNVSIINNCLAIGLHRNFNSETPKGQTNGAWMDLSGGDYQILPLVPPGDYRYSFFSPTSAKISESGHVFYISGSNYLTYSDGYVGTLVRYNPKTQQLDQAKSPAPFAVNQPEKMWDTETGQFHSLFYPSKDGRYVYGVIETYGVDGGVLHWDYKILFEYDFEKDEYTRLGDSEDNQVTFYGMTSSGREILYSGAGELKVLNLSSKRVSVINIRGGQGFSNNITRWNSNGYCSGETNNTIGVYNIITDEVTTIETPSYPRYTQFSPDGNQLYFLHESSKGKVICKTSNLTEEARIDTICAIAPSVQEFLVIK